MNNVTRCTITHYPQKTCVLHDLYLKEKYVNTAAGPASTVY